MKYYRLENPWSSFDEFFDGTLVYTSVRKIDNVGAHNTLVAPSSDQGICGFWVLSDPCDVRKFWADNPPGRNDEKSARAYQALMGLAPVYSAGRICTRIDAKAFNDEDLYPDLPLVEKYPSSKFHPALFNTAEFVWPTSPIGSERINKVYIPDCFVEVYYRSRWFSKSTAFGNALKRAIRQAKNINDAIPIQGFENAPAGRLQPRTRPATTQLEPAGWVKENRSTSWFRRLFGR